MKRMTELAMHPVTVLINVGAKIKRFNLLQNPARVPFVAATKILNFFL